MKKTTSSVDSREVRERTFRSHSRTSLQSAMKEGRGKHVTKEVKRKRELVHITQRQRSARKGGSSKDPTPKEPLHGSGSPPHSHRAMTRPPPPVQGGEATPSNSQAPLSYTCGPLGGYAVHRAIPIQGPPIHTPSPSCTEVSPTGVVGANPPTLQHNRASRFQSMAIESGRGAQHQMAD